MTKLQQSIAFLVALAVPIYWFWFSNLRIDTAVSSTVFFAVVWYLFRKLTMNSPELFQNVFALGGLQLGMLGTVNGVLSLIIKHLF